ncbi:MAG TPA: hypothetical protein VMM58_12570 [Bacteroidota bacterium]|nr:hypothetical protein [Bacteroidota bacterium]
MLPKIHAKFRKRHGVPYAIEQLSGRQFRCRHCNEIFFSDKELDRHIASINDAGDGLNRRVHPAVPALSSSIMVNVLYTYDITDKMKKKWLRLRAGEIYDGI